ncbi:MAG: YggT family protein [Anaerolineales bacterium]
MILLIQIIRTLSLVATGVVLVAIILRYFVDPYHPVRRRLDAIVEPLLSPIRRLVPSVGGFDLSPVILVILIQLVEQLLLQIIIRLH